LKIISYIPLTKMKGFECNSNTTKYIFGYGLDLWPLCVKICIIWRSSLIDFLRKGRRLNYAISVGRLFKFLNCCGPKICNKIVN